MNQLTQRKRLTFAAIAVVILTLGGAGTALAQTPCLIPTVNCPPPNCC